MFFGKFPGWWANTVAIYCPSRPSQLITKNIIIYGEWGDAQCCTSLTCPTWWKASMSVILTTAAFNLSLSRHLLALSRMNSLWYPLQGGDVLVPGKLVEAIIDQLSSHDPKTICDLLSVEGRRKLNCSQSWKSERKSPGSWMIHEHDTIYGLVVNSIIHEPGDFRSLFHDWDFQAVISRRKMYEWA